MTRYAYDVECLRTLFTATFVNVNDENDKHVFYIGAGKEDYSDLKKFLRQEMVLVGYNNHSYDDALLRFITTYTDTNIVTKLYNLSGRLIDSNFRSDKTISELRYPRKNMFTWKSIDLMRILGFDKLGISLKQVAINLKWHKIQDMPIEHTTSSIHVLELNSILEYNLNDVLITKRLYEVIAPLRELRDELSKIYAVDLSSASDSKMANLILESIYAKERLVDIRSIRELRTIRDKVCLKDCIASFVHFQTPALQELLDRISATYVYNHENFRYKDNVYFAGCNFTFGIGGLHTDDAAGIFKTTDTHIIQDMDVASYYPNLIINNEFYPEHLGVGFIDVLKKITAERLSAKRAKNKVKADGLKITINSIFGKLGSEHFWLLDVKQLLSTTITGQMGLLMLVEDLFLNGIEILSVNTDGIICRIPRELEDKYYEVARRWEKATNLELEYTPYKIYVRRDVNSYITEKEDGTTKEKGAFLKEIDLKKSYHMPIVAKALYAYFIKNIPIKKTLEDCKDIMEFCISQKAGSEFVVELHKGRSVTKLQKTNRFFITKKGGSLVKRNRNTSHLIGLYVGQQVEILNDYDPAVPFSQYNVNLAFYEKEIMKIVDEIEPKQMNLFEMSAFSTSSLTKMELPVIQKEQEYKNTTVTELKKLGKNQLAKRIETIANNREKIDGISSRYVYILEMDVQNMVADLYCLRKGTMQSIKIDKTIYKKEGLEKGMFVLCKKFDKIQDRFVLVDYKIVEKIEEERDLLV